MQKHGNRFGTHRVIEPVGVLPQPANKLDNNMDEIWDNEILIDVQTLNIDSASFTDIHNYAKSQAKNPDDEAEVMEEIKKEEKEYRELPKFYNFKSRDERERILYANFNQVTLDVKQMVDDLQRFFKR